VEESSFEDAEEECQRPEQNRELCEAQRYKEETGPSRQFHPIMDPETVAIRKQFAKEGVMSTRSRQSARDQLQLAVREQQHEEPRQFQSAEAERILRSPNLAIPVSGQEEYMFLAQ
jgi:hypothetical protein